MDTTDARKFTCKVGIQYSLFTKCPIQDMQMTKMNDLHLRKVICAKRHPIKEHGELVDIATIQDNPKQKQKTDG